MGPPSPNAELLIGIPGSWVSLGPSQLAYRLYAGPLLRLAVHEKSSRDPSTQGQRKTGWLPLFITHSFPSLLSLLFLHFVMSPPKLSLPAPNTSGIIVSLRDPFIP